MTFKEKKRQAERESRFGAGDLEHRCELAAERVLIPKNLQRDDAEEAV